MGMTQCPPSSSIGTSSTATEGSFLRLAQGALDREIAACGDYISNPPPPTSWPPLPSQTLSAVDICAILEKSKELGLTSFEAPGLKLTFGRPTGVIDDPFQPASRKDAPFAGPTLERGDETTSDELTEDQRDVATLDADAREEIRIAQLMIDDPVAYEQHMLDESLERERQFEESEPR